MSKWLLVILHVVLFASATWPAEVREADLLVRLRRSQIELRSAKGDFDRAKRLFEQGLLSTEETDRKRALWETAQLNYQAAVSDLVGSQPHLSVRSAIRYQDREGRKFIRLTIENHSRVVDDSQLRLLGDLEGIPAIPEELRTRDMEDFYVSLKDARDVTRGLEGALTIALPYESHIAMLEYGRSEEITFQLLRDTESVLVVSSFRNGDIQQIALQVEEAETSKVVGVSSGQPSQEVDLGGEATFDLRLTRSSVDVRAFRLSVLNLPLQVDRSFLGPASDARLSQIIFQAGVTEQALRLRLYLPQQSEPAVAVDKPIAFWVVVVRDMDAGAFSETRQYSEKEILESKAGAMKLEIIPRGEGRLQLVASSLFCEIRSGHDGKTNLAFRNTGTKRIENVRLWTENPVNWRSEAVPDVLPALGVNQELSVDLRIHPAPDAPPGEYEVRLKMQAYSFGRPIPKEDKVIRVSIRADTSPWRTAALLIVLLGMAGGVVGVGIKMTRR